MNQETFNLANLPKVDFGKVSAAFDHELKSLVKDCDDRPLDDKARTLTLKVSLKPQADTTGNSAICDSIAVEFEVQGKIPVRRTKVYVMKPKQDGSLAFHPDLADDPDGSTLYDEDQKPRRPE